MSPSYGGGMITTEQALRVACPQCGAGIGKRCQITPEGGRTRAETHRARLDAARAARTKKRTGA